MTNNLQITEEKDGTTSYTFPNLYKIDTQKRTRIWSAKIFDYDIPEIHVSHGLLDGGIVLKTTPVSKGKGKNTALEQAINDARSKFNAKINREGYTAHQPNLDEEIFIPLPMLAKTFEFGSLTKKSGKIILPAFVQAKLDGIRCFANLASGKLTSRQMKEFVTLAHIAEEVCKFGSMLAKLEPEIKLDNIWLDGEIYHHEMAFGDIQGICNSVLTSKHLTEDKWKQARELQYHIYDMYNHTSPNIPFHIRNTILNNIFKKAKFKHLVLLKTDEVITPQDIKDKHQELVEKGFEGIILRNKEGPYEPNRRSQHLQKYKSFLDEEYPIIDFKAADNDYWDSPGGLMPVVTWICQVKNGKTFSCKMRGTKESQHELFLEGKKHVGGLLTVIFQEYTPDGIPRFPVGKEIRDFTS
jgi:hypothetical protein